MNANIETSWNVRSWKIWIDRREERRREEKKRKEKRSGEIEAEHDLWVKLTVLVSTGFHWI
jgi:hypothetical protein